MTVGQDTQSSRRRDKPSLPPLQTQSFTHNMHSHLLQVLKMRPFDLTLETETGSSELPVGLLCTNTGPMT